MAWFWVLLIKKLKVDGPDYAAYVTHSPASTGQQDDHDAANAINVPSPATAGVHFSLGSGYTLHAQARIVSALKRRMEMRASAAVALIALGLPLGLPVSASADSMRCRKWVVNEDSSAAEVLEKCGEPQQKDISKQDVLARNKADYPVKLGVQVTERWYYKRSPGSLRMLVTVVDGNIKSIERAE